MSSWRPPRRKKHRPTAVRRVAVERNTGNRSSSPIRRASTCAAETARPRSDGSERDERHHVRDPDARMCPHVLAQVDAPDGDASPGQKRLDQPAVVSHERVDRPVVVGVGVDVEQRGVSLERLTDGADDAGVPSLRDVGHGLEHDPYPTKLSGWGERNRLEPTFRLVVWVPENTSGRNRLQPTAKPNPFSNPRGVVAPQ